MDIPGLGNIQKNMGGMLDKLRDHVDFPASKDQITDAVDKIPGVPEQAKEMVKDKLPDKQYDSLDDVKQAVGLG